MAGARAGEDIRVNVQLIDAATDEHLWADTYDRSLTAANIFSIQSEIVEAIAGKLQADLTPAESERLSRPRNPNGSPRCRLRMSPPTRPT